MSDQPTAGFRNAGWTMAGLPDGTCVPVHPLRTADGTAVNGFLYARGQSDTVLCIILAGNSGGASLSGFDNEPPLLPPGERLELQHFA